METKAHLLVSLTVGVALVPLLPLPAPLVVAVSAVVGVGIDADHFLIARLKGGDWAAVRRCLDAPSIVLFNQSTIFEEREIGAPDRLLSHVVLAGVGVGGVWLLGVRTALDPRWALVVAGSLYAHLLTDLLADVREANAVQSSTR